MGNDEEFVISKIIWKPFPKYMPVKPTDYPVWVSVDGSTHERWMTAAWKTNRWVFTGLDGTRYFENELGVKVLAWMEVPRYFYNKEA